MLHKIQNRVSEIRESEKEMRKKWLVGGVIVVFGCVIALWLAFFSPLDDIRATLEGKTETTSTLPSRFDEIKVRFSEFLETSKQSFSVIKEGINQISQNPTASIASSTQFTQPLPATTSTTMLP